jgi:branched-chain amino acid transport system permease protein
MAPLSSSVSGTDLLHASSDPIATISASQTPCVKMNGLPMMTKSAIAMTTHDYAAARARAQELLGFVKLERLAGEYAGNLSYGQQKLVEFTRVLMTDPELILLDEPAAGVNRTLLNELLSAVRTLRDAGKTVFLVEHDMKVVMGLCETVFVLDHGEKLIEGPPGLIQADERVIEAYFGR